MSSEKSNDLKYKYLNHLHYGATHEKHQFAKELRRKQTEAEQLLWSLLRNRKFKGKKFRRQHAIGNYVLDFYCHECKLAVELDGYHHKLAEVKEYDLLRTTYLNENGIKVLRFWNDDIIKCPEMILQRISDLLQ